MRFGTYYFLQAPPHLTPAAIVQSEVEQMAWTEELGFLVPEHIASLHPLLQPAYRAMAERLDRITWDALVAETVAFGSPDTVAGKIEEFRRIGVGEVLCWMNFGGLPVDRVRRSMELFAREVMPRFR